MSRAGPFVGHVGGDREGRVMRMRFELGLLSLFSAAWIWVFLIYMRWVPLAGTLSMDLYRLYSVAAVLGWVAGNVYMLRVSALPKPGPFRKRFLLIYWLGPISLLFLLRGLAPEETRVLAPLVPLYAACVQSLFFLVPVTLRMTRTPRHSRRS